MRAVAAVLLALPAIAACDTVEATMPRGTDSMMSAVYMMCLLALVLFGMRAQSLGRTLRHLAIFLALLLGLVAAYAYRTEMRQVYLRVVSELLPAHPVATAPGKVSLTRGANGHFSTLALVNGRPSVFLIDTGATSVVLPFAEAMRLGVNSGDLVFNRQVATANGIAYEAPILIDELEVGGIVLKNVSASVSEPGALEKPLLGMSFLNRLSRYSFEGSKLTLQQ